MADREDDKDTLADEPAENPEGRDAPSPTPVRSPDKPSVDEALARLDRLEKQLAASNKNAAAARRRAEELEEAERKREEAKLGEDERVKRQLKDESSKRADAEARAAESAAKLRQHEIDRAVEREAAKQDFAEPDLISRLVDPAGLEIDEDGKVLGVAAVVKKLAADRPSLLKPKPQGGTPVRDTRGGGTRVAARESVDEIKQQLLARQGHSYGSL